MHTVRVNWQIKAILPVVCVLIAGLLLFAIATLTLRDPDRDALLLLAGAGSVTVCGVTIAVLAYLIQRPVVELQKKMALVSQGDLNTTVSFCNSNDEIGDLGRNFNHMVQQLRESRQEIETMHRTQMSRAEHLATLGELATGLAHEIRNPLAGIAGVIDIIGRDLPVTSPARAMVKDVRLEIDQINRILTDLLQTARPHPPRMMKSNLNTTVEHAVMLARQQVISKPIRIEVITDPKLPEVQHDSDQIHQVILNLLLNAVQSIEGNGYVTVRVSSSDDCAIISVTDTGRGMSPQQITQIFRPFYTTKPTGTGLGLSLVHRIIDEHDGRITVTSEPNKGSTFEVQLPFAPAAEPAQVA